MPVPVTVNSHISFMPYGLGKFKDCAVVPAIVQPVPAVSSNVAAFAYFPEGQLVQLRADAAEKDPTEQSEQLD